jgi:hypothetical protein
MLKEADKFKAELERALASERMLQARVLELEGARSGPSHHTHRFTGSFRARCHTYSPTHVPL